MNKLTVQLSGGIGNQMFQYAIGRAFSIKYNYEFRIDTWTGFFRDKLYKRSYELDYANVKAKKANFLQVLPFLIFRIFRGENKPFIYKVIRIFFGVIIFDNNKKYNDLSNYFLKNDNIWLIGFWQSSRYFSGYENYIYNDLCMLHASSTKYSDIYIESQLYNSVAVCLRFYEESIRPTSHSSDNSLFDYKDVRLIMEKFNNSFTNVKFYIFSTSNSNLISTIVDGFNYKLITVSTGYINTKDILWLLSKFSNYIITNSTFYWWGCWFSQYEISNHPKVIYSAKNFYNIDSVMSSWNQF